MTKRELVVTVSQRLSYKQGDIASAVQVLLDAIVESLAKGERIEIRNFGVFEVHVRDARIGRNPKTGETVSIPRKSVAVFKPGKALKALVEEGKELDMSDED